MSDGVVAAAERVPAHVTGDGKLTIRELIDAENVNPLRGEGHEKPMTKIAMIGIETIAAATSAAIVAEPKRFPAGAPEEMAGWAVPGRGSVDKVSALAKAGMALL